MKENKLVDLSMDFAIKIIKLCETIKGHYSLVNQLERSATSIGAHNSKIHQRGGLKTVHRTVFTFDFR